MGKQREFWGLKDLNGTVWQNNKTQCLVAEYLNSNAELLVIYIYKRFNDNCFVNIYIYIYLIKYIY